MTHSPLLRRRAALAATAVLAAVVVLHLLWAAGMDDGLRPATGGMEPPGWIRPAALVVAALLATGCVALLGRAGVLAAPLPERWTRRCCWALAAALFAATAVNLFGATVLERAAIAPLCLALGIGALVVAREPRRPGPLDALMPDPAVSERHAVRVDAPPADALDALLDLRPAEDPVVRTLLALRRIPTAASTLREFFATAPFRVVEQSPGRVVFAARQRGLEVVGDLRADTDGRGTVLSTETRARARGPLAATAFRVYWLAVGPFSSWIRRRWLRAAARRLAAR